MNQTIKTIIIAAVVGALIGGGVAFAVFFFQQSKKPAEADLIKEFYLVENAVYVSPHSVRKDIMEGKSDNFILVDLRSAKEYLEEHIVGALNIPAYKDKDRSDYEATERIKQSFQELKKQNPEKDIIVYCYSIPCMTGRKIGKMLAEDGFYVRHLGIGWNEWRYFWELWNHPHEWELTDPTDYTATGSEPGLFKGKNYLQGELPSPCPIEGGFGC